MTAPDDALYSKLKYKPEMAESAPIVLASRIMTDKRFVSRYAVAAGVMSKATTRITPTACNAVTVTTVSTTIKA